MDYDVVLATRNRPQALEISIPLILQQGKPPKKLIVVDASDDHQLICKTVKEAVGASSVELVILNSQPNLPHQRNVALEYVESPVVMFPDDDSFWWSGVAEKIMRIYERDECGEIGGVCAIRAKAPPATSGLVGANKYEMKLADRFLKRIAGLRHKFDDRFCPNPMYVHGRSQWNKLKIPRWLSEENAAIIEYMNGLCMTYRSELIRRYGFDSDLGAYVGWAANEDIAASFAVMQELPLVCALNAKVCHYKFPSQRSSGFALGFINHFNRSYVISRYSPPGSAARRALKRFGFYKALQYLLGIRSRFGRDRVRGHMQALRSMKILLESSPANLRDRYLEQCQKVLAK